jgi:hypothetical protein
MMNHPPSDQLKLLLDLEMRHEDLLVQLRELDRRVEKLLTETLSLSQSGSTDTAPAPAAS